MSRGDQLRRALIGTAAAVIAMLATTLTVVTPSYAIPAGPVNLTPDQTTSSGIPTLSWDWVPGATRYLVEVSNNQDFTGTLLDSASTPNRSYVPDVTLPANVYWRVAAQDSTGTSSYSTASFTRAVASAPTQVSPADNADVKLPDAPPVLTWSPVVGALSYDVKVGPDFNNPSGFTTTTVKATSFNYKPGQLGEHSWQVRALVSNSAGVNVYTEWSPVRSFVVKPLLLPDGWAETATPRVTSQGMPTVDDAVLDWDPIPGAVTYQVQVHTDQAFPSNGLIQQTGITSTSWARPSTLLNDQYYWRVRAVDAYGLAADWSTVPVFTFQRAWRDRPVPVHPAQNSTVNNPFYFQWDPAGRLASRYAVQLTQDSTFNTGVETCYTVHTTYVPAGNDCMPEPGLTYYWRVIGIDGGGNWNATDVPVTEAVNAQVNQFTMQRWMAEPLGPASGDSGPPPTLSWAPVSGAARYQVVMTSATGGPNTTITTSATQLNITSNLFPELLTAAGAGDTPGVPVSFTWQVIPVDAAGRVGNGFLSGGWTYTVTQDDAGTANQPIPVAPANGTAFQRFPSLKWTALPVASVDQGNGKLTRYTYRVFVRQAGSTVWPATPEGTTFHAAFTDTDSNNLAPGSYEWMVQALLDNTVVAQTPPDEVGSFTIAALQSTFTIGPDGQRVNLPNPLPEVVGEGAALRADATGSARCTLSVESDAENCAGIPETPILSWAPIDNAGSYQVYLSRDQALTQVVSGYPQRVDRPLFRPTDELPDSQAGVAYYWYVQPCTDGGKCNKKTAAQYGFEKTANRVVVDPPRPTYGTDASGNPIVRDDVTLSWQDFVATNLSADTSASDIPDHASIEANKYRVQWATDAGFTANVKDSGEIDQKQFTLFSDTFNEGDIYWHVQAKDQTGNWLPYSATQHMVRRSPTPTLLAPVNDASSAGTDLVWQPLAFAASYDLEIYKAWNASTQTGTTAATANNVPQSTFSLTTPLPFQPTPYYWRVRRNDAKGKDGQWSAMQSFTIDRQDPVLMTPAVGERVEPNEEVFSWAPASEAHPPVAYRWQRRKAGQTSTTDNIKTYATRWAPTGTIADGQWEWRVVALDASDAELGASAWRAFTSSTKPLVVQAPEISGGVQVGQVLSVSTMPVFEPSNVSLAWQWLVGGSPVTDATGTSFEVRGTDVGKAISVRVTASRPGYDPVTITSAAKTGALGVAPIAVDPVPTVTGTARTGATLTVTSASWSLDGVDTKYQWKVGSTARGTNSATSTTYVVQPTDVGQPITVVVTGSKPGYSPGSYVTGPVTAVAGPAPVSPVPIITGAARVGDTLTASGVSWKRNGTSVSGSSRWQWRRDGQAISGATGSTYRVAAEDAGHMLSVQASLVQTGYATGSVTSAEVRVAASAGTGTGGTTTGTGTVSVNGRPYVRSVLPSPGARIKAGARFRITFSESVNGIKATTVKLTLKGTRVRATLTVSADRRTVVLRPKSKLKHGKTYKLTVTSGIRDLTGLSLSGKYWKYRVR